MKIAFVFPGYKSQFIGMGKDLYDVSRNFQECFEEASNCLEINFVKLCFASSDNELSKVTEAYLSIFLISSAIANELKSFSIIPYMVAGYGIGEYAAAYISGGINFPDTLYLLKKYASLYEAMLLENRCKSMLLTGYDKEDIQKFSNQVSTESDKLYLSVFENDEKVIVTGSLEVIENLEKILLNLSYGSFLELENQSGLHSPLMDDIVKSVTPSLEKIDFKDVNIGFVSSVIAKPLTDGQSIKASLIQQIHAPLYWQKTLEELKQSDVVILIGPGELLLEQIKSEFANKVVFCVNKPSDVEDVVRYCTMNNQEAIKTNNENI